MRGLWLILIPSSSSQARNRFDRSWMHRRWTRRKSRRRTAHTPCLTLKHNNQLVRIHVLVADWLGTYLQSLVHYIGALRAEEVACCWCASIGVHCIAPKLPRIAVVKLHVEGDRFRKHVVWSHEHCTSHGTKRQNQSAIDVSEAKVVGLRLS